MLATVHASNPLHPALDKYLYTESVRNVRFNASSQCYEYKKHGATVRCGGLIRILEKEYYPNFVRNPRRFTSKKRIRNKKGSSALEGKRVDEQIQRHMLDPTYEPTNPLAQGLLVFWKHNSHLLQVAQVPVPVKCFGIITQADVITVDSSNKLWMWEIKCGYPPLSRQSVPFLRGLAKEKAANNTFNHWELQRHFTAKGLVSSGVPLKGSHVLHVYEEWHKEKRKKVIQVKRRPIPKWTQKL